MFNEALSNLTQVWSEIAYYMREWRLVEWSIGFNNGVELSYNSEDAVSIESSVITMLKLFAVLICRPYGAWGAYSGGGYRYFAPMGQGE